MAMTLKLNGKTHTVDAEPARPCCGSFAMNSS